MRDWLFYSTLTLLLLGCSDAPDDLMSEDVPPTEQDQDNVKPQDAGRDAGDAGGSKPTDAGTKPAPIVEPEFEECATSRTEAKRGLRGGNVIWVIDTSGSMDQEAALVRQNLNAFVQTTSGAGLDDYRVVMVSEQEFVDVPDPLRSDAAHFLYVEERVGSDEPLEDLLSRFEDYRDFLLPDVTTHFVVVTDDESNISADDFIAQMDQRLAGEFRVHAVASPPGQGATPMADPNDPIGSLIGLIQGNGCTGAYGQASAAGVQNYAAAMKTGGRTFSICSEDWTPLFTELATEVSQSAVPCALELPASNDGTAIDPSFVNVVFTPPAGASAQTLLNVGNEAGCTSKKGWYYDNPSTPTKINLCPSSCTDAAKGGALDIALGCITRAQ